MDVMDELKHLHTQRQVLKQENRKLTYDEYNKLICNRMQRINAELYLLEHELTQDAPQRKIDAIHKAIQDFSLQELNALHEQLKDAFY